VSYPIEFAVKEIYQFDPELAIKISRDFLSSSDKIEYDNLGEWFKCKFGEALAEMYFIPYNNKIWGRDVKDMKHGWVQDKLPIPDKKSFFNSLISTSSDNMPHSSFYYPKSNDQNTFLDALAVGVNILYNVSVDKIRKDKESKKWIVNDRFEYDILINTTPLDRLPSVIDEVPDYIKEAAALLKYNKISNVLWETKMTDKTWTYLPDNNTLFHRYIHIGTYFNPPKPFTIAESIGEKSYEELIKDGSKDDFLITPIDYNQSEHAYVVFDDNYEKATSIVREYLSRIGIYTLGRFGEWQYYNMDVCIKKSIELSKLLIKECK
jgi:protoporphyrinogen oxidase